MSVAAARGFRGCPVRGPGETSRGPRAAGAARERAPREGEGASVEEEKPGQISLRLSLERREGLDAGRRVSLPPGQRPGALGGPQAA